jgi:hypothetical protein
MWMRELGEAFDVLARTRSGHATLEIVGSPYCVRFLLHDAPDTPPRALVEAVSNESLDVAHALVPAQAAMLARLGWHAPGTPCDPGGRCRTDHRNWHRFESLSPEAGARRPLLATVLATLVVYGADGRTRCAVSYTTSEGATLSLP